MPQLPGPPRKDMPMLPTHWIYRFKLSALGNLFILLFSYTSIHNLGMKVGLNFRRPSDAADGGIFIINIWPWVCFCWEMPARKATHHESLVNLFFVVVIHDNPLFSEGDIITHKKKCGLPRTRPGGQMTIHQQASRKCQFSLSKFNGQRCLYKFYLKFR